MYFVKQLLLACYSSLYKLQAISVGFRNRLTVDKKKLINRTKLRILTKKVLTENNRYEKKKKIDYNIQNIKKQL